MSENRNKYSTVPLYGLRKQRASAQSQGGGFQIQAVRKKKNNHIALQMLLSLILPALLLLAFIFNSTYLFWAFTILAVVGVAYMWLRSAFIRNARATLTLVYIALVMVSVVAIWISTPIEDEGQALSSEQIASMFSSDPDISLVNSIQANQSESVVPTNDPNAISPAQMQLDRFMDFWQNGDLQGMLSVSLPSWASQQENTDVAMFRVRANRTPTSYQIESVTGSDADTSRTVNMLAMIDRNNGNAAQQYRFQVLMLRVNETWYIDPQSLGGTLVESAPQQASGSASQPVATNTPSPQTTIAPTFILYYNKSGGKYYHADPSCKSINSKYLPLSASFYYRDVSSDTYKNLRPCPECNAPAR